MSIYSSKDPEVVTAQKQAARATVCAELLAEWREAENFAQWLVYGKESVNL